MKSISHGMSSHEFHSKCVCQICTCQRHHCPHSQPHIPHEEISTYQKEYIRHPLATWAKPPPEKASKYLPYDYINSCYRQDYPGHRPHLREKLVPRVKDEKCRIDFSGSSEYKTHYGIKSVPKERPIIKDKIYNPDHQPFDPTTTYKSDFLHKKPNLHTKTHQQECLFPEGYKFNPNTTYNADFLQKKVPPAKNYKPIEKVSQKGFHDLNSIYRQDFTQKEPGMVCPVTRLPSRPSKVNHPSQHLAFNKYSNSWVEK